MGAIVHYWTTWLVLKPSLTEACFPFTSASAISRSEVSKLFSHALSPADVRHEVKYLHHFSDIFLLHDQFVNSRSFDNLLSEVNIPGECDMLCGYLQIIRLGCRIRHGDCRELVRRYHVDRWLRQWVLGVDGFPFSVWLQNLWAALADYCCPHRPNEWEQHSHRRASSLLKLGWRHFPFLAPWIPPLHLRPRVMRDAFGGVTGVGGVKYD